MVSLEMIAVIAQMDCRARKETAASLELMATQDLQVQTVTAATAECQECPENQASLDLTDSP